jgi:hypothetical protein
LDNQRTLDAHSPPLKVTVKLHVTSYEIIYN